MMGKRARAEHLFHPLRTKKNTENNGKHLNDYEY